MLSLTEPVSKIQVDPVDPIKELRPPTATSPSIQQPELVDNVVKFNPNMVHGGELKKS